MKKWMIAVIMGLVVIAGVSGAMFYLSNRDKGLEVGGFRLSEEFYGQGELKSITATEFAELVERQQSFVVIARMTVCPAEFPLKSVAKQFALENEVVVLDLVEEEFKETELAQEIKYLPSAAIYRGGKMIAYLDAAEDADIEYYQTAEGFAKWLAQNGVKL